MSLVELLRALVTRGVGLAPSSGGLGVYPTKHAPPRPTLTPELRAAVGAHKTALTRLLDEAAVRRVWRIPEETPLGPRLGTALAWLLTERLSFTSVDYRLWLEAKTGHLDAGARCYVADILATAAVATQRLEVAAAAAVGGESHAAA